MGADAQKGWSVDVETGRSWRSSKRVFRPPPRWPARMVTVTIALVILIIVGRKTRPPGERWSDMFGFTDPKEKTNGHG